MIDLRERVCARLMREVYHTLKEKNHLPEPIILAGNREEAWIFPGARLRTANQASVVALGATWYGIATASGTIETHRKEGGKKQRTSIMNEAILLLTSVDGQLQQMAVPLVYSDKRRFIDVSGDVSDTKIQFCVEEDVDLFGFRFKEDVPLRTQIEEIKATVRPMLEPILKPIRLDDF